VILLAAATGACSGDDTTETAARTEPVKIGMVLKDNVNQFWESVASGARSAARDRTAVELIIDSPQLDTDIPLQIAKVESMITRGVDALVVAPGGPQLRRVLERATESGIPVVLVDSDLPDWDGKAALVATDNVASARAGVETLIDEMGGSGQLGMITMPGIPVLADRDRGARQAVAGTNVEVVQTVNGDCDVQKAQNVTENLLRANPGLDGIFANCDFHGIGAAQGLRTAGKRPGEILLFGHDGTQDEIELVKRGWMTGTVAQRPREMGSLSVRTAVQVVSGRSVPREVDVPFTVITAANASTVEVK
jgi:ABC-type sugar transport system substrate-binding protein